VGPLDIGGVGQGIGGHDSRKFENLNPKLETISKFKIQMTETGASTCAFLGF
jgi:hypothetical protein